FFEDIGGKNDEYIPSSKSSSSEEGTSTINKRYKSNRMKKNQVADNENTVPNLIVPYSDTDCDAGSDYSAFNLFKNQASILSSPDIAPDLCGDEVNLPNLTTNEKKQKLFPPRDNTSKKRKRNPECWKKNKAALNREKQTCDCSKKKLAEKK
ncbi:hypothetical protein JTE90_025939, partial [Oedothorax gibbosus]